MAINRKKPGAVVKQKFIVFTTIKADLGVHIEADSWEDAVAVAKGLKFGTIVSTEGLEYMDSDPVQINSISSDS